MDTRNVKDRKIRTKMSAVVICSDVAVDLAQWTDKSELFDQSGPIIKKPNAKHVCVLDHTQCYL